MVVEHNPGLEGLLAQLCGAMKMPMLAVVDLDVGRRSELPATTGAGRLVSVWRRERRILRAWRQCDGAIARGGILPPDPRDRDVAHRRPHPAGCRKAIR
jgi:hypothetical protein